MLNLREEKKSLLNNQKSPKGRPSSQTHLTTNTYRQRNFPLNEGLEGKIINNHRYNSHSFFPIQPAMAARASHRHSRKQMLSQTETTHLARQWCLVARLVNPQVENEKRNILTFRKSSIYHYLQRNASPHLM